MPTYYFEGMPEKKVFPVFFHTNISAWSKYLPCYWNIDWSHVLWSDETKILLFGNQHFRAHGIMNLNTILNLNQAAPARELKLGRC